jgi:hypothetical protein
MMTPEQQALYLDLMRKSPVMMKAVRENSARHNSYVAMCQMEKLGHKLTMRDGERLCSILNREIGKSPKPMSVYGKGKRFKT